MKATILVVEDDRDLAMLTARQLQGQGYQVVCAEDGKTTMAQLEKMPMNIILLDVMLPDCDGHELCERIRSKYDYPIIFMSCLGDSTTIVQAFRGGGNDYLVKPVNISELVERIEENLKNSKGKQIIEFRQFILDKENYAVYKRDEQGDKAEKLELSPTEYKLLLEFVQKPDEILLYKQLYRAIWEHGEIEDIRTLMVHVSNLRKKIDYQHRDIIRAVRGVGYIFSDE